MFSALDRFVEKFMSPIFDGLSTFWAEITAASGNGAYFCMLLLFIFFLLCFIIGLIKLSKRFGLFIVLFIIMVIIPIIWFFVFK